MDGPAPAIGLVLGGVGWLDAIGRAWPRLRHVLGHPVALILGFSLSGRSSPSSAGPPWRPTLVTTASHRGPGLGLRDGVLLVFLRAPPCQVPLREGADFVAVSVFMFASTNLVLELGIVLVVLLGWQFAWPNSWAASS